MSPSSTLQPLASKRKQSQQFITTTSNQERHHLYKQQQHQLDHHHAHYHHNQQNSCNQNHYAVEERAQYYQVNQNSQQQQQQQQQYHQRQRQQQPISIHMHSAGCHLAGAPAAPVASVAASGGIIYGTPEAAANAMVAAVRLVLVIFIGVLLLKLRLNCKSQNHQKRRREQALNQFDSQQQQIDGILSSQQSLTSNNSNNNSSSSSSDDPDQPKTPVTQDQRLERHRRLSGHQLQQVERLRTCRDQLSKLKTLPGPTGLPMVGYLPFLEPRVHITFTELSAKYGSIYQVYLGKIRLVVLNDVGLIREAFKQSVFSGRPDTQLSGILKGYGVINSDGALWREQRLFLHQAFRKLGAKSLMSGDNGLEAKIQVSTRKPAGQGWPNGLA